MMVAWRRPIRSLTVGRRPKELHRDAFHLQRISHTPDILHQQGHVKRATALQRLNGRPAVHHAYNVRAEPEVGFPATHKQGLESTEQEVDGSHFQTERTLILQVVACSELVGRGLDSPTHSPHTVLRGPIRGNVDTLGAQVRDNGIGQDQ